MSEPVKDTILDTFKPGLEGIPACKSSISFVDGINGILEYRGFSIKDLTDSCTFEEVSYLLLTGKLPQQSELTEFISNLNQRMFISEEIQKIISLFPSQAHPMSALQTGIATLGMVSPYPKKATAEDTWKAIYTLIAKTALIIGAFYRHQQGMANLTPDPELGIAGNLLLGFTNKEPSHYERRMMDACLILHAEHTLNASTFTARVIGSTLSDPFAMIAGAVASLKGPLHGGANEAVMDTLRQIENVDHVEAFLDNKIQNKQKIMGLGHRVYKTKDPRAVILQDLAKDLFKNADGLLAIAEKLENEAEKRLSAKGIYPNVDFYSGLVYHQLGIPQEFFTPIFAAARVSGWLAHWVEQLEDNRIFRPRQIYTGEHNKTFVHLQNR